jgi:hypothetical protein
MPRADRSELEHSTARSLAAVAGTVPLALSVAVALALALPLPLVQRLVVGGYSTFPVWVAASVWIFLSRSGKRAWLRVGACTAAAALIAVVAATLRGAP